jgi:sulfatase maturation enzyme AslB (radical SAM superfamily)
LIKKNIGVISENLSWVGISLDGMAETNGRMRISKGGLSDDRKFEVPLDAVKLLRQKNPKIKIILSTTATKENYADIPMLGKYLFEQNIPINLWKINLFMPRRFRAKINKDKYEITAMSLEKLGKNIDTKALKSKGVDVLIRKSKTSGGDCLIVSPDGKVSVSSTKIADINENSSKEIVATLEKCKYLKDITMNKKTTYV